MQFRIKEVLKGLCAGCENVRHIRFKDGKDRFRCAALQITLHSPAEVCSSFEDRTAMSSRTMQSVAWILRPTDEGKFQVFRPGEEAWEEIKYETDWRVR